MPIVIKDTESSGKSAFDLTCANAVQSLFEHGPKDPFAMQLVAAFTDLFIYQDTFGFPLLTRSNEAVADSDIGGLPSLVTELQRRDPAVIEQYTIRVSEELSLENDEITPAFNSFAKFALNNSHTLQKFVALHNQPWIIDGQVGARLGKQYVYSIESVEKHARFGEIRDSLCVSHGEMLNLFDIVLRYGLYGARVGANNFYLAHPIRTKAKLPTIQQREIILPQVPVRIGKYLTPVITRMTLDDYTSFLHEARQTVRELEIVNLPPHSVERERLRELAIKLHLPPKLKNSARKLGVSNAVFGALTLLPVVGPTASIGRVFVSFASLWWKGEVASDIRRVNRFKRVLEWDIEKEAEEVNEENST